MFECVEGDFQDEWWGIWKDKRMNEQSTMKTKTVTKLSTKMTSWGWMATARGPDGDIAELMHFDKPGSFHSHQKVEHALCVAGSGEFIVEGTAGTYRRYPSTDGVVRMPADWDHRMEPGPEGMTCVIWYTDS